MASAKKTVVTALSCACASASLLLPLSSFSANQVAVWDCTADGKGLDTTQGGIAISAGLGNSFSNGKLVIANSGVYSGGSITLPSGLSKASVLVKYSNFAGFSDHEMYGGNDFYAPVFMSVEDSDGYVVGIGSTNNAAKFLWNWRTNDGYHEGVLARHFADGPALPSSSGYVLFSYEDTQGMRLCLGTSLSGMVTEEKPDYRFSGRTLVKIGLGGEASGEYADGWPDLVIEKVALFAGEFLSAEDVEDFKFPTLSVSEINMQQGSASEITVNLDDGDIVVGDTTFTATKVNFVCDGSFTLVPPAGNTAVFDFSGVTGRYFIRYDGALPTVSGTTFTANTIPTSVANASDWTGTIWLRNINVTDFNVNSYGNASSIVRLSGISGWLTAPGNYTYTNTVPVELCNDGFEYALRIVNGNSANSDNPLRSTAFVKISGDGKLYDFTYAKPVIKVFDMDEFTGDISLAYGSCLLVCDPAAVFDSLYDIFGNHPGSLRIESGKAVAVPNGKTWNVMEVASYGNLTVNGTLTASVAETFHGSIAGSGRIVASGFLPSMSTSPNINLENWTGTFSLSNVADLWPFNVHLFSSTNSTLELTAVGTNRAYLAGNVTAGKVVLTDDGETHALVINDDLSDNCTTFCELAGTGTFSQSKDTIYQGITINVITNFTGTLSLGKMTVTFGTEKRTRSSDKGSGLYIDPDANVSVPVGFSLWSPVNVVLNGPLDFTTNDPVSEGMVLLDNMGSNVKYGENFNRHTSVSINGTPLEQLGYYVFCDRMNNRLVTKKLRGFAIRLD